MGCKRAQGRKWQREYKAVNVIPLGDKRDVALMKSIIVIIRKTLPADVGGLEIQYFHM